MSPRSATRRSVLVGGLGTACGAALAACGGHHTTTPVPTASYPSGTYPDGLHVVAFAAALEGVAVRAYDLVLSRSRDGSLGTVPAAVTTFATTAREHHADHAGAWNAILTAAGRPTVSGAPLSDAAALLAPLTAATSLTAALSAVAGLEGVAASTYLDTVGTVTDGGTIRTAATIAPVEAQHAAVLTLLLGSYPVPAGYLTTGAAVKPTALTLT